MTSTRRQRQAEQTRREILEAARDLFARQGYNRTTVAEIAAAAGVSVQTIYDSVGSKGALVRSLNDLIRDASGVPPIAEVVDDPAATVDDLLAVPARAVAAILRTNGDIIRATFGAAGAEPELAVIRDEGTRRHRAAARRVVERLAERQVIDEGIERARLADGIAVITQPDTWLLLIDRYGWTLEEAESWAIDTIRRLVLGGEPTGRG